MEPDRWQEVDRLLKAVLEIEPCDRDEYLEVACRGDRKLLSETLSMLRAVEDVDTFMEEPLCDYAAEVLESFEEPIRCQVDGYRLIRRLGEGGMGVVYLAEETRHIKRQVALKVIRPGIDCGQILTRFRHERQILAGLNHPNIANILDAGETHDQLPFFTMEYIDGLPITYYCRRHGLDIETRIHLFRQLLNGLQFLHSRGVIHRDLKPSNVLVCEKDSQPVVKIIDMGVSRVVGGSIPLTTMLTEHGFVGTRKYCAPEQIDGEFDVRSDIYSSGLVLYEMLTGKPPINADRFDAASLTETLRIIQEEELPAPSKRVKDPEEPLEDLPYHWRRKLSGDLDWITGMMVAKDRGRRYPSVSELLRDLNRYLENRTVSAGPPGLGYQLTKFCKRNKFRVATASLSVLVIAVAIILSLQNYRTQKNMRTKSLLYTNFLSSLFPKDEYESSATVSIKTMLERADVELHKINEMDPTSEALFKMALGRGYRNLADYQKSKEYFQTVLNTSRLDRLSPELIQARYEMGSLYFLTDKKEKARELYQQGFEDSLKILGPRERLTLRYKIGLALTYESLDKSMAQKLYLELDHELSETFGNHDHDYLDTLQRYALFLRDDQQNKKALEVMDRVLELRLQYHPNDDARIMESRSARIITLLKMPDPGNPETILTSLEQIHQFNSNHYDDLHPRTIYSAYRIGLAYKKFGRLEEAFKTTKYAAELHQKHYGDQENTWLMFNELYLISRELNDFKLARQILEDWEPKLEKMNNIPSLLMNRHNQGDLLIIMNQPRKAETLLRKVLDDRHSEFGPTDPATLITQATLAEALMVQNRYDKAIHHLEACALKASSDNEHFNTYRTYYWNCLSKLNQSEARLSLERTLNSPDIDAHFSDKAKKRLSDLNNENKTS